MVIILLIPMIIRLLMKYGNFINILLKKWALVSTMIERDDHIPPLDELITELEKARKLGEGAC